MRQIFGSRRIAIWAERSLWALGLSLLGYWGWSQASIRFEQARLEESFFAEGAQDHPDDAALDDVAQQAVAVSPADYPELEPGAPIALIEVPRVGVRAMVVEGVDHKALKTAVGHIPRTALPGMIGNVVVAAHRDTLFAGLRDVELGDVVTVKTEDRSYTYRVSSIDVVDPYTVEVMDPTTDAVLTMITCFPFDFVGPAPMRYIVRAQLQGDPERSTPPQSPTTARARRPLDPEVLSFLSGSLVKPGAN
jgi:sortase A